jgi:hypothetical protein
MAVSGDFIKILDFTHAKIAVGVSLVTGWSAVSAHAPYSSGYQRASVTVTFPVGLFSATPVITVNGHSGVPGALMECSLNSPSASGFTAVMARSAATDTSLHWQAIEIVGGAGA